MNVLTLDPNLLTLDKAIRPTVVSPSAWGGDPVPDPSNLANLAGTLYSGFTEVHAQRVPGASDTSDYRFNLLIPTVDAATFDLFRTFVQRKLGAGAEQAIAQAAGIRPSPPPQASSRMAAYARLLYTSGLFGASAPAEGDRSFSVAHCKTDTCWEVLTVTRELEVTKIRFSGRLPAVPLGASDATSRFYIPISYIEFADGLTIPFAGYSDQYVVDDSGPPLGPLDPGFWTPEAND